MSSLLIVQSVTFDSSACTDTHAHPTFYGPLDIEVEFEVADVVNAPSWCVSYIADVVSQDVQEGLTCSLIQSKHASASSSDTAKEDFCVWRHDAEKRDLVTVLRPGERYRVHFCISGMREKLSGIKVKYLKQVSVVKVELRECDEAEKASALNIVCQPIRPAQVVGDTPLEMWQRRLYDPLR